MLQQLTLSSLNIIYILTFRNYESYVKDHQMKLVKEQTKQQAEAKATEEKTEESETQIRDSKAEEEEEKA